MADLREESLQADLCLRLSDSAYGLVHGRLHLCRDGDCLAPNCAYQRDDQPEPGVGQAADSGNHALGQGSSFPDSRQRWDFRAIEPSLRGRNRMTGTWTFGLATSLLHGLTSPPEETGMFTGRLAGTCPDSRGLSGVRWACRRRERDGRGTWRFGSLAYRALHYRVVPVQSGQQWRGPLRPGFESSHAVSRVDAFIRQFHEQPRNIVRNCGFSLSKRQRGLSTACGERQRD